MKLCDAHAHPGTERELEQRRMSRIPTLLCATTPEQFEQVMHLAQAYPSLFIPTWGIHPWNAGQYGVSKTREQFQSSPVIGEIGMDNVWCQVPVDIQKAIFIQQLQLAQELNKPVILHTKGMEKELGAIIRDYPNRYLVHWYSAREYVEAYLECDCYWSVGPDVWWNEAVQNVVRTVPDNRLLIETDGMGAVRWAFEEGQRHCSATCIPPIPVTVEDALSQIVIEIARIRQMDESVLANLVWENFWRFCTQST